MIRPRVESVSGTIGTKISASSGSRSRFHSRRAPARWKAGSAANGSQAATSAPSMDTKLAYRLAMLPAPTIRTRLPAMVPLLKRRSSLN